MATDSIPPPVIWAQRADRVFVTLNVEDCKEPDISFGDDYLKFKGHGGPENRTFEVTMTFHKEIDPKQCQYAVLSRHIPVVIKKKDDGPYWPRLLKDSKKVHWLKTDFDKWRDEDDSDNDEGEDTKFEEMMKQMGNFSPPGAGGPGGPGGDMSMPNAMPVEENDSDDEDLPDLE